MDGSANTGMESNCSDAEIRKSSIRRIVVEGYDTSLRMEDVDGALRKHFGIKLIHVYVPINFKTGTLCRFSLIYVNEEDEEKVLRLDGSDMGGRVLKINPYPFHENHLEEFLAPIRDQFYQPQETLMVTCCDNSLPLDVIETELKKYYSALGAFVYPHETASGALITLADVNVDGQEGVEKALQCSGRSVGGLNFVITEVSPPPIVTPTTGYIHPFNPALWTKGDPNVFENLKKMKKRERNQKKKMKKKSKMKSVTSDGNKKMQVSF